MGTLFGLKGFCAAIIGGLGNNLGAILGGFLLGIIQELGAGLISLGYKDAISFIILIIFLIMKPSGILGNKWKSRI
jgi:branched-chain amino acid transport system permease protein